MTRRRSSDPSLIAKIVPLETDRRSGNRILRAGETVCIVGERGKFKILGFRNNEVDVFGGPPNRERLRTFLVGRIGRRPRKQPLA